MQRSSVRHAAVLLGFLVAGTLLVGPESDSEARPGGLGRRWTPKKPAPPKPKPIELKRISEVGGARWSSSLGFVTHGEAPKSEGAAPAGNLFIPAVDVPGG